MTDSREVPDGDDAESLLDQSRIQELTDEVCGLPEIRGQRVAALGRALKTGIYKFSPEEAAEALLSDMQVRSAA